MNPSSTSHIRTPLSTDLVASEIETFLRARFQIPANDQSFSRQSSLWEDGYVDSIGAVELIVHIETTFELSLPDEVLFDPEFTSVSGIAGIVCGLSAQQAG